MTDEQINAAIAEVCGWKEVEPWLNGDRCFELNQSVCGYRIEDLPDYCTDLNAMHEAEMVLRNGRNYEYLHQLERVTPSYMVYATARQRAEAFLKTVEKWEE
jgi:hypothetical protein